MRGTPFIRFFGLLAMAVLACNLGGLFGDDETPQVSEGTAPPPIEIGATQSGPPLENPITVIDASGAEIEIEAPAQDFQTVMNEMIEAGEVSEAEALINSLKPLVGEAPDIDLYSDKNVDYFEATGLVSQAYQFLETSEDPAANAEIQRLLNAILPPLENLETYSVPEDSVGTSSAGRQARSSQAILDEAACRELWKDGFPPDDASTLVCLLHADFTSGGHQFQVYYPESRRDDPGYVDYVRAAEEALRESITAYSPLTPVDDLSIIFALIQDPVEGSSGPARALTALRRMADRGDNHCPIIIFPAAFDEKRDDFKQVIAHEIFHCVQGWRLGIDGVYTDAVWYIEGGATYFSNVVYPTNNLEHRFQKRFDVHSLDRRLFNMAYETTSFFQHLGNLWGDASLISLFDQLNTKTNFSDQAAVLVSEGLDQDAWHGFGKLYMDQQIIDTGGGPLPISIFYRDVHVVESTTQLEFESKVFLLGRDLIRYKENTEFDVEKLEPGDEGLHSVKNWPTGGAWEPVPTSFRTPCGEFGHVLLLTIMDGSDATTQLVLKYEEGDSEPCDCIIGSWRQNQAEAHRILSQIVSSFGTVTDVTGDRYLVITGIDGEEPRTPENPGTITLFPQNACATVVNDDLVARACITGVSSGQYYVPEVNRITVFNEEVLFIVTVSGPEGSVSYPLTTESLGGTATSTWEFACTEDTLTSITGGAAPFSSSSYDRVSPLPTPTPINPDDLPAPLPGGPGPFEVPPGGPGSESCNAVSLEDFSAAGDQASWNLVNGSGETLEISGVSLDWPESNSAWEGISLDGEEIWRGSLPLTPDIVDAGWEGGAALRQIEAGGDAAFALTFSEGAGAADYVLVVDFTNGCLVTGLE